MKRLSGNYGQSAEGTEAVNEMTRAALKHFINAGPQVPLQPGNFQLEGVDKDQVANILRRLAHEGLIENASVKQGFFTVSAHRITRAGEHLLERYDEINSENVEAQISLDFLKKAAQANGPIFGSIDSMSPSRQDFIISGLKRLGYLKDARITQGFFAISAVEITDAGKEFLEREATRIQPDASRDIEVRDFRAS